MPGQRQPQVNETLERGVYLHPFTGTNGERYAVAVNRSGCRVLEATIYTPDEIDEVIDMLWQFLDRRDPGYLRLLS